MPRQGRITVTGGIYHIIQRGIERREIYRDDKDRKEFLKRLEKGLQQTGDQCYGWVLMPNHFHLLIRSGVKPLNELMRGLLTGYALYFNRRYRRSGYLYQGRYKSILCQEDAYLLELVRYVHLNPWRGKLVKDLKELQSYPWSGHAVIMGKNKAAWQETKEVLARFGQRKHEAVERYLEFIKDGSSMGKRDDLTGGGLRRSAGGWEGVCRLRKAKERWQGDERILGDGDFVSQTLKINEEKMMHREKLKREGWDIEKLVKRVCEIMLINKEDILKRSKNSNISKARNLFFYWGNSELGMSGSELGQYFGLTRSAASQSIKLGESLVKAKDYKLTS
jgi:putative transposase